MKCRERLTGARYSTRDLSALETNKPRGDLQSYASAPFVAPLSIKSPILQRNDASTHATNVQAPESRSAIRTLRLQVHGWLTAEDLVHFIGLLA